MKFQKFCLLMSLLFASNASAAPPASEAQRAEALCKTKYAQETLTQALDIRMCLLEQNILIIARRMDAGELGLAQEVRDLRAQLALAKGELEKARSGSVALVAAGTSVSQSNRRESVIIQESPQERVARRVSQIGPLPSPALEVQAPPVLQAPLQPHNPTTSPFPRYRLIDTPGQQAATTYQVGGNWLNVQDLMGGAEKFAWGVPLENIRIIIRKNGKLIPILQRQPEQLASTPVEEAFGMISADLNRDGKPDSKQYSSIDPSVNDTFWVSGVGPDDSVEMLYLFLTGKSVEMPGREPAPMWGHPKRVVLTDSKFDIIKAFGKWHMDAHNAQAR